MGYVFKNKQKIKKKDSKMNKMIIDIDKRKIKKLLRDGRNKRKVKPKKIPLHILRQLNIPEEFH